MTDQEAAAQMDAATAAIRAVMVRLLKDDELHPQVIVLALAHALGEFAAGTALAGGEDIGPVTADLAELVREAIQEHHEMLCTMGLPVAGSA